MLNNDVVGALGESLACYVDEHRHNVGLMRELRSQFEGRIEAILATPPLYDFLSTLIELGPADDDARSQHQPAQFVKDVADAFRALGGQWVLEGGERALRLLIAVWRGLRENEEARDLVKSLLIVEGCLTQWDGWGSARYTSGIVSSFSYRSIKRRRNKCARPAASFHPGSKTRCGLSSVGTATRRAAASSEPTSTARASFAPTAFVRTSMLTGGLCDRLVECGTCQTLFHQDLLAAENMIRTGLWRAFEQTNRWRPETCCG